jgi:hypothetical protein
VLNPGGVNIGFDGLAISGCTLFPHTYREQVHGDIQIAKYPNYTGDGAYGEVGETVCKRGEEPGGISKKKFTITTRRATATEAHVGRGRERENGKETGVFQSAGSGDLVRPRMVERWRKKESPVRHLVTMSATLSAAGAFINRIVLQNQTPANHRVSGSHPTGRLLKALTAGTVDHSLRVGE